MPEKETIKRTRKATQEGKSPSTQAGEFVREEIHHVREGKHGARSTEQAIAIGLSKARRAGVKTLVLSHMGPHLSQHGPLEKGLADVGKVYGGRVLFAEELMAFEV